MIIITKKKFHSFLNPHFTDPDVGLHHPKRFSTFNPEDQHLDSLSNHQQAVVFWPENTSNIEDKSPHLDAPKIDESLNIPVDKTRLTRPEDKTLITDFLYTVTSQLRRCEFSENDVKTRGGVRTNIKIGFGGMQCLHCMGKRHSRKFFWSNVDRLANSFSEIASHVMRCKHTPRELQSLMKHLKNLHQDQMSHLPRGSQKVFFRRMWRRIHSEGQEPSTPLPSCAGSTRLEKSHKDSFLPALKGLDSTENDRALERNKTVNEEMGMTLKEAASTLLENASNPTSISKRVLLAIDEDKDWLSENDTYLRRNIEVFCATSDHIQTKGRHTKILIGQIGLRCVHCSKSLSGKDVPKSAVFFPKTIDKIYSYVRKFYQDHLKSCPSMSDEMKAHGSFNVNVSISNILRKYYVDSAKKLGMRDTESGIRVVDGTVNTPKKKGNGSPTNCNQGNDTSTKTCTSQATAVTPLDAGKMSSCEVTRSVWL